MTTRRTLFHQRKDKPRSVSKIGLLLCLLLAGGVMVVPASSGIVLYGKAKVRDLALSSGFISFKDCVVTWSTREVNQGDRAGLVFYGTKGTLDLARTGYKITPETWTGEDAADPKKKWAPASEARPLRTHPGACGSRGSPL